jgi:hypothetical protein
MEPIPIRFRRGPYRLGVIMQGIENCASRMR